MKKKQEFQKLLEQLVPRSQDEIVVAMATIAIDDRIRPSLPNKKYTTVAEWEVAYRKWRVYQEEAANAKLLQEGNCHLQCGRYYHHAVNSLNGFSTSFRVTVDVMEPGLDFQVATLLKHEWRGSGGFAHYEVHIASLGTSLSADRWVIAKYQSATLQEYVRHVALVSKQYSLYTYDIGREEQNVPNRLSLEEVWYGLGMDLSSD